MTASSIRPYLQFPYCELPFLAFAPLQRLRTVTIYNVWGDGVRQDIFIGFPHVPTLRSFHLAPDIWPIHKGPDEVGPEAVGEECIEELRTAW